VNIKILRPDNGGEFKSAKYAAWTTSLGIIHQFSSPHTPSQNGKAERLNRTIIETAKCMLHSYSPEQILG
jgi:transposase InsO family protein